MADPKTHTIRSVNSPISEQITAEAERVTGEKLDPADLATLAEHSSEVDSLTEKLKDSAEAKRLEHFFHQQWHKMRNGFNRHNVVTLARSFATVVAAAALVMVSNWIAAASSGILATVVALLALVTGVVLIVELALRLAEWLVKKITGLDSVLINA